MLDEVSAATQVQLLWPSWKESTEKAAEWEKWSLGEQELPAVPGDQGNDAEIEDLRQKARGNWLGLVTLSLAQALVVEGYRTAEDALTEKLWQVWQRNRMDRKQGPLYESAITTGISYLAVLPTGMKIPGQGARGGVPEWRPYTSGEMAAFYNSKFDDWPEYAMYAEPAPRWQHGLGSPPLWRGFLIDNAAIYLFDYGEDGTPAVTDVRPHQVTAGREPVTPIIRYVNRLTLNGAAIGEVRPHRSTASRIDQTELDRLIVQRFAAWVTKTATGLEEPDTDEQKRAQEIMLKVSDILTSDSPDTKFGSLPASPLDGHIRAANEDIRKLASESQTPPQHLTGDMTNVSADALVMVEASFNRKVEQRKLSFGESHEQAFNLTAEILDETPDPNSEVRWRDMESRALSQIADALVKLAQLEIPVEVLWDKLPFLTEQERERAIRLRDERNVLNSIFADAARQIQPVP